MGFSILSIILSLIVRLNDCLSQWKMQYNFKYKTKLKGEYIFDCRKFKKCHIFSNKGIAFCIENVLKFELHEELDQYQTLLPTEVLYIESLKNQKLMYIFKLDFF